MTNLTSDIPSAMENEVVVDRQHLENVLAEVARIKEWIPQVRY